MLVNEQVYSCNFCVKTAHERGMTGLICVRSAANMNCICLLPITISPYLRYTFLGIVDLIHSPSTECLRMQFAPKWESGIHIHSSIFAPGVKSEQTLSQRTP